VPQPIPYSTPSRSCNRKSQHVPGHTAYSLLDHPNPALRVCNTSMRSMDQPKETPVSSHTQLCFPSPACRVVGTLALLAVGAGPGQVWWLAGHVGLQVMAVLAALAIPALGQQVIGSCHSCIGTIATMHSLLSNIPIMCCAWALAVHVRHPHVCTVKTVAMPMYASSQNHNQCEGERPPLPPSPHTYLHLLSRNWKHSRSPEAAARSCARGKKGSVSMEASHDD
jgi:hypothetical protein